MKPSLKLIPNLVLTLLLVMSFGFTQTVSANSGESIEKLYPKSYALVIGVNQAGGEWSPLSSAEDDANTFADHLERRGFEVIRLFGRQATKMGILKQLQTVLPEKVGTDDRFIFYFAGHGQTQKTANGNKVGYIVPADGSIVNDQNQWHTYLSMRELKSLLTEHVPSKHTLLLFDSCFSGLMFTRGGLRRSSLGAKANLSKKGVMALTAGASGQLALDGLFTPTLIQALSGEADENMDGFTSFQEIALYTRREVQARRDQQTPQFGILTGSGQMIFESKVPSQKFSQGSFTLGDRNPRLELGQSVEPSTSSISWGLFAIGGVALGIGGVGLILNATQSLQDIESEENDSLYDQRIKAEFGNISSQYTAGWIIAGFGVGAIAWGIYQKIAMPTSLTSNASTGDHSPLTVMPLLSPNHAGVSVTW